MQFVSSLIAFIFGASIGSFLNVLIDRLPSGESINGRSHCDYCGKKIAWYDLFPIISFIFLKAKSRCCKKKLSFQYPLIEIVTGLVFTFITNKFTAIDLRSGVIFLSFLGIVSSLIVIFVSDLKYHLISDYILLALFIFSVPIVIFLKEGPINSIISAIIVCLPIFLIYFISKERAMGLGDVYLSAIMGFFLGWKEGLLALYIAFITGALFGLMLIAIKNKKLKSKVAFGPFLVIGTIIMMFWGEKIIEIIKKIYGI
jgi:prepilin signal peptidase PulO-like enzyme (type II secretory pathway)